jgi:putative redox protein
MKIQASSPNQSLTHSGISVRWVEEIQFEATLPSGCSLTFDSESEEHPRPNGPSPLEAFLAAAAGCSAMDVIGILVKKRQKVKSYRVEVTGERDKSGEWPHRVTAITLNHILEGEQLDEDAVRQTVELSDQKYCTVVASLRAAPQVSSVFTISPQKSD